MHLTCIQGFLTVMDTLFYRRNILKKIMLLK